MPRVTSHTRSTRKTKYPYTCRHCGQEITAGQGYYEWEKRYGGPQRVHTACGYPKPSMLSNRKTAVIEDALIDARDQLASWDPVIAPEGDDLDSFVFDADVSDVEAILETVADCAREVSEEYGSGADNMPEALQYSPTAEAMREVAQELESWADSVADSVSSVSDPDIPERDDEEADEDFIGRIEEAISDWAEEVREAAESEFDGMPEYQG